jgi:hypothetical protein
MIYGKKKKNQFMQLKRDFSGQPKMFYTEAWRAAFESGEVDGEAMDKALQERRL